MLELREWCAEAERGLAAALGDYPEAIRDGVKSGRMQLWRVDGESWLVTQVFQLERKLVIWCYQGRNARRTAEAMFRAARANDLEVVEFSTRRKGLPRLLREFGFELTGIDHEDPTIREYQAVIA